MTRLSRRARVTLGVVYAALLLLSAEAIGQIAFRIRHGAWLSQVADARPLLQRHPYLAAMNTPSVASLQFGRRYTHDSLGFRGSGVRPKRPGTIRVIALGGSSTYCTGVNDDETWPSRLQEALGPRFEVLNAGTPGYTTVENLIQTAFVLPDLQPDLCIFYEGYNDLRNSHVRGLAADYSNFHGQQQMEKTRDAALRFGERCYLVNRVYRSLLSLLARRAPVVAIGDAAAGTRALDQNALAIYRRNLATITALCRARGYRVLFVPQRISEKGGEEVGFYVPFIARRDLPYYQSAYNDVMRETAAQQNIRYAGEIAALPMSGDDFLDAVHLSPRGCKRFAAALAPIVRAAAP
jgi:lysophospholipase L1-like esterase